MPILRNIQMARTATKQRDAFEYLYAAPTAYRPTQVGTPNSPRRRPIEVLHQLAQVGRSVGATAGDVNVLAVELLWAIDEERSYARGFDSVVEMVVSGELRTVAGVPMRQFLSMEQVAAVLEMVAVAARPEAYQEYVTGPHGDSFCEHDYARFELDGDVERLICEGCGDVLDSADYQDAPDPEDEDVERPALISAPASSPDSAGADDDDELARLEQEVARLRAAKRRAELKAEIATLRSELGLDAGD